MLRHPYYLETKRYNICLGREEAYLYQDLDFYNENTVGPLSRISMTDPTRCEDPSSVVHSHWSRNVEALL